MADGKSLKKQTTWWDEGIRFECQGSGKCCTSHGEFGFVFLTKSDRQRMAKHLKISTLSFSKKYCDKKNGAFHLKEDGINLDCLFLKDKKCSIYEARPTQCRTWPFWPEIMNAKSWKKEVVDFCPGVGKGKVISAKKIKENLELQKISEDDLINEAQAQ